MNYNFKKSFSDFEDRYPDVEVEAWEGNNKPKDVSYIMDNFIVFNMKGEGFYFRSLKWRTLTEVCHKTRQKYNKKFSDICTHAQMRLVTSAIMKHLKSRRK